ncbi:uncharacterized protein At1g76070-like [Pistacia vera]|uniref:uncharacterized protein At1g76070-like n=1 Tax=Pistacia vera TaxID=55513 RepID=UPI0012639BD9|nr:uncharacterized protein At1g76070-like [Pistacia vera]
MEKHAKPKTNILKFLPKASAVTFQNLPFSPGREKRSDIHINKLKAHAGKGFSGPIISIIPDEARRKSKNESFEENQEPTSPKVSCMGQIKKHKANHKMKMKHMKTASLPKDTKPVVSSPREVKKQASKFMRLFSGVKPARKSDVSDDHVQKLPDRAPALNQMKRFASGRDAFSDFDWTAHQIAPLDSDHRNYYSDEERGDSDQEEEEDYIIPFSAPITVGGGVALQPKKEVNLWKRRTMNPPRPLQLNTMVRANS